MRRGYGLFWPSSSIGLRGITIIRWAWPCGCSIVGKYRTGKSFLMNKLLDLEKDKGFTVSPTVDACTKVDFLIGWMTSINFSKVNSKGIWIWSIPIYMPKDDYYIFFLDTEGLDSIERDSNADSKLFALTVLLSSYFIFNSLGCIDESSISQLSIITHLIQNVTVQDGQQLE